MQKLVGAMCNLERLAPNHRKMVARRASDLERMMRQAARVLRPYGRATYVLGTDASRKYISGTPKVLRELGTTQAWK